MLYNVNDGVIFRKNCECLVVDMFVGKEQKIIGRSDESF